MKITGVDAKECVACGKCIDECVARLYSNDDKKNVLYADPHGWCTGCGHCIAVCPENAIVYEAGERSREPAGELPDYTLTMHLLLTKRSVRNFTPRNVPKSEITSVLQAMRFAPSGHNAQPCEYIVITNSAMKEVLRKSTIDAMRSFRKVMAFHRLLKPFVPEPLYKIMADPSVALGIDDMVGQYTSGKDPVFFNAPAVLLVHVPDKGAESYIDPSIAFTYGMLAAHARGLGSCWMGFTILAVAKNRKLHHRLDIPKGRIIAGVMIMGYPANRYERIPVRNSVKAAWIE